MVTGAAMGAPLPDTRSAKNQALINAQKNRIRYSEKYQDEVYEYRHVILPKDLKKLIPDRLMDETEWRSLGVQQSPGWVHYMNHAPEKWVLCFRRPLSTQ
eukprot:TRINITY_DN44321_c0_g1_i1.p1 TRINITY_DN44321_c0_g1~~TRINITY_DN44321_c0_g1_i1.p1  ORF type:complete len:100 (+),score=33.20 TRINITY_DN44321_c0_g1_i1:96-395(+)